MTKIKFIYAAFIILTLQPLGFSAPHFTVGAYNVENFFDALPNNGERYDYDDSEFTPAQGWDRKKFELKAERLAYIAKLIVNGNESPDVLGLIEVENERALHLMNEHLGKHKYRVGYVSRGPDVRGINLAVLSKYPFCGKPIEKRFELPTTKRPTRPIMAVTVCIQDSPVTIIMNHWPSRVGGEERSEPNRIAAAIATKELYEQIMSQDPDRPVIIMGDFNDEPENDSLYNHLRASEPGEKSNLYNLALEIANFKNRNDSSTLRRKRGSYYYRGSWNALDQILINYKAANGRSILSYIPRSYSPVQKHPGINEKGIPVRFLDRKKQITKNGVSDHLPVFAKFQINTNLNSGKFDLNSFVNFK